MNNEDWINPFVAVSHELLNELNVVDEPFMLTTVTEEYVACQCFYATVIFNEKHCLVFENYGEGGMCPIHSDYFRTAYRLPKDFGYVEHRQQLCEEIKSNDNLS